MPFLPTLAEAVLSGELVDGWPAGTSLPDATIFLPTRRAGRELRRHLAARTGGRGLLLPRIVPLGDTEEDAAAADVPGGFDLPPAIPPIERRLILTRLTQAWSARLDAAGLGGEAGDGPVSLPGSPADAVALAGDLEALMDGLTTEDVDWDALAGAVEVDYSHYFRLTLDFVRIAHEHWPAILAERGASDPARRRNAALDAEAARIAAAPPAGPIVAAGSTGSLPPTARLLAAIARAPHGAVVLPGLDLDLDEEGWAAIGGGAEPRERHRRHGLDPGEHGHPQFLLRRLLETHLGATRADVRVLGRDDPARIARRRLLSEVLRPADTTDRWSAIPPLTRRTLALEGSDGLAAVEAADEREEALAIAVALRETLEAPGHRAALVTPDRSLARRVAAEMGRWDVAVDDSAGSPLSDTPAGRLARLAADAAAGRFEPAQVAALLAHPDVTLGLDRTQVAESAAALEITALRGPAPRPGLPGLRAALDTARARRSRRDPRPRCILADEAWDAAADLLERLDDAFRAFSPQEGADDGMLDLVALAARHAETVERLTEPAADEMPASSARPTSPLAGEVERRGTRRPGEGERALSDKGAPPHPVHLAMHSTSPARGEAGGGALGALHPSHAEVPATGRPRSTRDGGASFEAPLRGAPQDEEGGGSRVAEAPPRPDRTALDALFDDLAAAAVTDGEGRSVEGRFADYPAFFAGLARGRTVAPEPGGSGARVRILGLLEARLLDVERVVLGGLDETIWPPAVQTDAFLNRPMRARLGLSPPERRIGQTAHDFAEALGVRDAIVTRAAKRGGKPTVPSRFLERLAAFSGERAWTAMRARGERWLRLARRLDAADPVPPARRPAPRPGAARFPRRLSVTEIETLVRDPYAIYARHVLRLDPLDPLAVPPSAADRGTILHEALGRFAALLPGPDLPADAADTLLALGMELFGPIEGAYPELHALWWPDFRRLAPRFVEWEAGRRAGIADLLLERPGLVTIPIAPGDDFQLAARADRIELGLDGSVTIVDFKTGQPPTDKVVAVGFSPQMTLQAAMLERGGFAGLARPAALPALTYLRIGGRKAGEALPVKPPKDGSRSLDEIVAAHWAGLVDLVRRYGAEGAPYLARPYPQYARAFAPYDHLARVKEWAGAGEAPEGGA